MSTFRARGWLNGAPLAAHHAVEVLNRIQKADASVLPALIAHRVPCNEALADDPTVQVGPSPDPAVDHTIMHVGLLGIINGLFGTWGENDVGFIAMHENDDGSITFALNNPEAREDSGNAVIPPAAERRTSLTDDPNDPRLTHGADTEPGPQNEAYLILSEEERAKGFVRPVRDSYIHVKCGGLTRMSTGLAETYARNPRFYGATYCVHCSMHLPVGADGEFVWDGTDEKVGT